VFYETANTIYNERIQSAVQESVVKSDSESQAYLSSNIVAISA
jgi:hypothetical protein